VVVLAACVALVTACGGAPSRPRSYPGVLHAPSTLGADFLTRQRIVATYQDQRVSFDAVVQKRADTLTLLGLTPFGSRAFLLEQRGGAVRFVSYVPRDLPFPPRNILIDVHRVFFFGIAPRGRALSDGAHVATREGEIVRERWSAGRLVERRFTRASGDPRGEIAIRYQGGAPPNGAARRIDLANGWFGYRLVIDTLAFQRL